MEVPSIFLNRILSETTEKGASSLHFSVGSLPLAQVDGRLIKMENEDIITSDAIENILNSFISSEEKVTLDKEKEVVIVKIFAGKFRFRVNVFYQRGLLSLSFNHILGIIRSLEDLGLLNIFKEVINLKSGLLVIAGLRNSGRSTTAAAFIEELNKKEKKYIITIEDPIEHLFINKESIVEQRQVGRDVGSYSEGINLCLDEDVDLAYIDEQKKGLEDTISSILKLASGNSLVITEINASSSIRAIEKILNAVRKDMSQEAARYILTDVLIGIVTQNLIPKVGGGMALATEILIISPAVRSLIREGKIYQIENIVQTSREEGMISMKRALEVLARNGVVEQKEIDRLNVED